MLLANAEKLGAFGIALKFPIRVLITGCQQLASLETLCVESPSPVLNAETERGIKRENNERDDTKESLAKMRPERGEQESEGGRVRERGRESERAREGESERERESFNKMKRKRERERERERERGGGRQAIAWFPFLVGAQEGWGEFQLILG